MPGVTDRITLTAQRFASREGDRSRRLRVAESGGNWSEVDDPQRVATRARALGLERVATAALVGARTAGAGSTGDEIAGDAVEREGSVFIERIIEASELQGVDFLLQGANATRSVGRIVIRDETGSPVGFGTGFLVAPGVILTNNHVLGSPEAAARSTIQFDHPAKDTDPSRWPTEFAVEPNQLFITNGPLDMTLVAIAERNPAGENSLSRPWNRLGAASGKALVGERINLLQHPGGGPLRAALRDNRVVDVFDDFLHYRSDTERGSSGAPAFNDQWQVVALHHSGVPRRDDSGAFVLLDGTSWPANRPGLPIEEIAWIANEGVRISRIVAHLTEAAATLDGRARELLDVVLSPPQPPALDSGTGTGTQPAGSVPGTGVSVEAGGSADGPGGWLIPLELKVREPERLSGGPGTVIDIDLRDRPGGQPPITDADPAYFDSAANSAQADSYYAAVPSTSTPADMFDTLSRLVTITHTTEVRYDRARLEHLYPTIDRHPPTGVELRSIYSGQVMDAAEIIRNELAILAAREIRITEFVASEQFAGAASLELFLAALEAESPFNCEHVVPQSWFGATEPMRGDLHHLFTCESRCNSFRGNKAYRQFDPTQEVVREECGRREGDDFEPLQGKGPAARATMYFLLRYPGMIGERALELSVDRLETLSSWHDAEPPSLWELHRNAEIAAVQGNRNPFVDRPDWVSLTDLGAGLAALPRRN